MAIEEKLSALICPTCGERQVKVLESRQKKTYIYRRRVCEFCFYRFSTKERVAKIISN